MSQIYGGLSVDVSDGEAYNDFQDVLKEINDTLEVTWGFDYDTLTWEQSTDHDDIEESLREILKRVGDGVNIYGQIVEIGDDDVIIYRVKNLELEIIEI